MSIINSKSLPASQSEFGLSRKPTKKELQEADDYHQMKDYYCNRYMSQLRDKILELDKKPASPVTLLPSRDEASKSKQKKNITCSTVSKKIKNRPVKTNIPKSARLTLLEVEHKLKSAGFLKTDDELAEFRNGVSAAEDIGCYADDFAARKASETLRIGTGKKTERPLSKIKESRENISHMSSRPSSKGIPKKEMNTNLNPMSGNKKLSPAEIAKAAAAALEKRCPRMDVPDLHCLRPASDDSDDESEIAREDMRYRHKNEYATRVAYLREMYQRAQANTAQAKRIIDNRPDDILQFDKQRHIVSDLTDVCCVISPTKPTTAVGDIEASALHDAVSPAYDPSLDIPDLSDTEGDTLTEEQEHRVAQWRQESQQPSAVTRQPFNLFTPIEEEPASPVLDQCQQVLPYSLVQYDDMLTQRQQANLANQKKLSDPNQSLTLDAAKEELKVIESKSISTFWPNYLNVGESKFARKESTELAES
ncbi:uncharacterized protein [Watersipora subatra]|uniref:uncharacterized protein n=1 Tax=Watersipora subatra TaxID=2589382 RepID=UPI00355BACA3